MSGVNAFFEELNDTATFELRTPAKIEDRNEFPNIDKLRLENRHWVRLRDVVAVVVDLKNSTKLDFMHRASTSARLYEAVTGSCVRIVNRFEPGFVDVQGDGLFALYHGEVAFERAMCAGITLKSFSQRCVVPSIEQRVEEKSLPERFPKETGLKIGMHAGVIVVKKVGMRGTNEPVWAGRPVNWASKCAKEADANELIATESVYVKFEKNHYVRYSCGCQGGQWTGRYSDLWKEVRVKTLPDSTVRCMKLNSYWCEVHGDEFCQAILNGKKERSRSVVGETS